MNYKVYNSIDIIENNRILEKKSEMSESQIGFLFGLLNEFQPKKIVEVGISAGGTSVGIINFINENGLLCNMYSVDLAERYYRDPTKPCGYLIEELDEDKRKFHTLLTGDILPNRINEIGDQIDFLILDTVHSLPGELLDFLAIIPFLKKDAIVVIHDTALHHEGTNNCIATNVLFQAVTAEKFLNNSEAFPNIAAFRINEDTEKYILDIFCALMLIWEYMPDEEQIKVYDKVYSEHYGDEALLLWEQAKGAAVKYINRKTELIKNFWTNIDKITKREILIYGAGRNARGLFDIFESLGVNIKGFVISDNQYKQEAYKNVPIYYVSKIPQEYRDALIIVSITPGEVASRLDEAGYEYMELPIQILEMLR